MPIYAYAGIRPVVHESAFVHPDAVVIGDVIIGEGVMIGTPRQPARRHGAVIVERGANVQDHCMMHGFPARTA
jgi:carbonic anhydrase/acetyltransferase-like protein (isoleucine patch superfamily)